MYCFQRTVTAIYDQCSTFVNFSCPFQDHRLSLQGLPWYFLKNFLSFKICKYILFQPKTDVPQEAPVDQEEADLQRALALRSDSSDISSSTEALISSFAVWKLQNWRGFSEKGTSIQVRMWNPHCGLGFCD